jgi:hypothetical protein
LSLGAGHPCSNPFNDPRSFKLPQGRENMELEFSRRGAEIYSFVETYERDPQRIQLVQQRNEMAQVSTQAIKSPTDQHIESPSAGLRDQPIQGGPAIFRAGHPMIDKLPHGESPLSAILPEFAELILGFLIQRAHAGIQGRPHDRP